MLVLSRRPGESIVIADDIVVQVVEIGRGRVQVGIVAPPNLAVHREEVYRRIQQEHGRNRLADFTPATMAATMGECTQPV